MRIAKKRRIPSADNISRVSFNDFSAGINRGIDDSLLPFNYARNTYNFRVSDGALTTCKGFKKLELEAGVMRELPANAKAVWWYGRYDFANDLHDGHIMVYCADRNIYYKRWDSLTTRYTQLEGVQFYSTPSAVNYRLNGDDVIVFSAPGEGMLIWDGVTVKKAAGAPPVTSMAVHYERLFATVDGARNAVWFSDDLDPSNWNISSTEAGFIEMVDERGALIKVVQFLDYLYVFREYGISRVTAYGEQSQFSVTHLMACSGKICPKTVTVCGDRIYFLASDGMYVFDGVNSYRVFKQLDGMWRTNSAASGCFHDGKLLLACNLDYGDGLTINNASSIYGNNTVIEYDTATGALNMIRGVDVYAFCACKSTFINKVIIAISDAEYGKYLCELDGSGCFFDRPLPKCWQSGMNDLGRPDKSKIVKAVNLLSKHDAVLTVATDTSSRTVSITGSEKAQRIKINVQGRRVCFEFKVNGAEAVISNPVFEVVFR